MLALRRPGFVLPPLLRLGVALFFALSAYNVYGAALPLYFADLGFEPTLIGLLIGTAGVAELVGALAIGPAIDRFGARRVLAAGLVCYLSASLGYTLLADVPALVALRLVQGLAFAATLPATYSFVPHLARAGGQTVAFASLGAAGNLATVVCVPLGLSLLEDHGPRSLFVFAAAMPLLAAVAMTTVTAPAASQRPFGLTFRQAWLWPLLVVLLAVIQWGVIQAFVPVEAAAAGHNPALLFMADAVCVLASRVPAGWIADRSGPLRLALVGVVCMTLSPSVLLLPMSDGLLLVAGVFNGLGAGLTLPAMLAQLSSRSDEATRGTGLAFYSVAFAVGGILGASGGGLLYPWLGFHGLLAAGALLCAGGLGALLADVVALRPTASPTTVQ